MSFNSNPSRVEYVVTVSTNKTYTFNFKIFEPENLVVYKIPSGTLPDDKTNKLLLNVDYTVSINGDLGGFITLLNTTTIHDIIIIQRTLSIDRVTDFVNNGGIYSDVLNNDQDYQTYLIGDNEIENARHLKLPVTAVGVSSTLPTPIPNRYMLWNPQGTALINDVNAPAWLTDAKGWAINPQDELFTDSTGTIDYSSKHYALYTSGRLDTVQTNGFTVERNLETITYYNTEMVAVAGNITDVTIVAGSINNVNTTADSILNVNLTGNSINSVNTVATNIVDVNTVATNIVDVQNAYENAQLAYKWAEEAEDVEVQPGLYSAKHWATKALDTVYNLLIDDINISQVTTYSSAKIETIIDDVNLQRADKFLASQNIANMIYTLGDLTKIRYINDNDTNYEVLSYTSGNLSTIDHYIGTVLQGTTTLSYTDGNLVSAIFVGV